jgi:hypothetical protein
MKPHQRVMLEKQELDRKILKLGTFIDTDAFHAVEGDEQTRLFSQLNTMHAYSAILGERIAAFQTV